MVSTAANQLCLQLKEGRQKLFHKRLPQRDLNAWLTGYTDLLDGVFRRIYELAWETGRRNAGYPAEGGDEPGLLLLAIGGYGRGDVCPHSDIDIAFVPEEEEHPLLDAVIKEAFRLVVEVLIDGAGLDVSYAYRPISDCELLDYKDKTALLSARRLAGDEVLLHDLRTALYESWDAVQFLLDIAHERQERARRLPLSLYAVEPNLKEGSGALRDIQTAMWVAGAMLETDHPLQELRERGVVMDEDATGIMQDRDFFLQLRIWLHLETGTKTDVLRLQWQDRCARDFNYVGSGPYAAQQLLSEYYRHAYLAARFLDRVLRRLLKGPLRLDNNFVAQQQRLQAAHPYTLRNHPELVLAPFHLSRKYGFRIDADLDRAIDETLALLDGETITHTATRAHLMAMFSDLPHCADALTELRGRGILQRLIPEFETMLRLAPPDPAHQLTVGEHSIYAVRRMGEMHDEHRTDEKMMEVWDGVSDHPLLIIATLLHDVGKISSSQDHCVSGAPIAARIGQRLGLAQEQVDRLAFLVQHHLLLPRLARLADLDAPATIREVMQHVTDVPTLKMLYLISLADTCSVGERTYSRLDLEALEKLYERVMLAMTREETAQLLTHREKREQLVQQERERLRREMRNLQLDEATLQHLCETLPTAYILNTPRPTIATHLKLLEQLPEEGLIVDFYGDSSSVSTETTVVTYDDPRPGLLSKICGVVHAVGAQISMASVYTLESRSQECTDDGQIATCKVVLDRLHLTFSGRGLAPSVAARLAALLREVLVHHRSVESVLEASGKETFLVVVPQRVAARNDLSDEHTVVSVVAENVPGLLFHITRALAAAGLDIHTAKITTWAGRAEDAFYVTYRGADGRNSKVRDEDIHDFIEMVQLHLKKPQVVTG